MKIRRYVKLCLTLIIASVESMDLKVFMKMAFVRENNFCVY